MTANKKDGIEKEAGTLSKEDQFSIAKERWASLNELYDDELDQKQTEALWGRESDRRIDEFDKGLVEAIPGEEVFRKIRQRKRK